MTILDFKFIDGGNPSVIKFPNNNNILECLNIKWENGEDDYADLSITYTIEQDSKICFSDKSKIMTVVHNQISNFYNIQELLIFSISGNIDEVCTQFTLMATAKIDATEYNAYTTINVISS